MKIQFYVRQRRVYVGVILSTGETFDGELEGVFGIGGVNLLMNRLRSEPEPHEIVIQEAPTAENDNE